MIATLTDRLGIDRTRLRFTGRTALAGCLALVVAWALGLEHPQWAVMSVWAASLPVRGQLLEKGANRLFGTILGSLFGMALMAASGGNHTVLVIGLSLWLGLCAGAGNLLRGFASYGAILAGYSAAMVALLDASHPENILALGADRMLTVLVGVAIATAVGWLFAGAGQGAEPHLRVRALTTQILGDIAAGLRGTPPGATTQEVLLSEMAGIEETLDAGAAGSLRARLSARATRRLLSAQVSALLWLRAHGEGHLPLIADPVTAAGLDRASATITEGGDAARALRLAAATADPGLARVLTALADAPWDDARAIEPAPLHRDWTGAREAAIRAALTIFVVGLVWIATGWTMGAYMMLGTSVMLSVFSTFDNPFLTLRAVLLGQVMGVMGALAVRWVLWPLAGNEAQLMLLMMPAILLGAPLLAQRRIGQAAFDYNMVVMLMLQPVWPLDMSFSHSVLLGIAVIAGPVAGMVAYRLIFPVDAGRRLDMLRATMVRELVHLAGDADATAHAAVWRARLHHRVLRLVRWSEKTQIQPARAADNGLAVLTLGRAILHLHDLAKAGLPPAQTRRIRAALSRLRMLESAPEKAARTLRHTAEALPPSALVNGDLLREAADDLTAQRGFFDGSGRNRRPRRPRRARQTPVAAP